MRQLPEEMIREGGDSRMGNGSRCRKLFRDKEYVATMMTQTKCEMQIDSTTGQGGPCLTKGEGEGELQRSAMAMILHAIYS